MSQHIHKHAKTKGVEKKVGQRHQENSAEQENPPKYSREAPATRGGTQDADVHFVKSADEKEAKRWLAERKRHDESFKDVLQILKDTGYDTKQIKYRPIPEIVFSDDEEEEEEEEENYRPLKFCS